VDGLPSLPERKDPFPELLDFSPEGADRNLIVALHKTVGNTAYAGPPKLLHGDFWPENVLWNRDGVAAIVDWEDSAIGDPLSDVACCQLELRYKFGSTSMRQFYQAYAKRHSVDIQRLRIWQVYVAAAACKFMGTWGLPASREARMRCAAEATLQEAIRALNAP
jgi:aminoglycoside phosphotransferase (APT) family kinase protein